MAEEPRKHQHPSARPPAPAVLEPIRVRELAAMYPDVKLPLPAKSNIIKAGPYGNTGDVIRIQYEPWQRHHRLRLIGEGGVVKIEVCIPESWVSYTPDEG